MTIQIRSILIDFLINLLSCFSLVCTPSSLNKLFGLRQDLKKQQAAIFLSFTALSGEIKLPLKISFHMHLKEKSSGLF